MVDVGEKRFKLQIWDTAGQERYNTIRKGFYRGAKVCVLISCWMRSTNNLAPNLDVRHWVVEWLIFFLFTFFSSIFSTPLSLTVNLSLSFLLSLSPCLLPPPPPLLLPLLLSRNQGVIIVYDITNPGSFSSLTKWVQDITSVSDSQAGHHPICTALVIPRSHERAPIGEALYKSTNKGAGRSFTWLW